LGGPEFPQMSKKEKLKLARRRESDKMLSDVTSNMSMSPAVVTPYHFAKSMPRRVEAQIRNDWALTPAMRNLWFRFTALTKSQLRVSAQTSTEKPSDLRATELTEAAGSLYQKLWKGVYGKKRRKIAGDTTKLRYAEGLTENESRLLRSLDHIASALPGTQQVRLKMGHAMRGGFAVFGNATFMTISPSDRHSGLMIRLSRYRRSDPAVSYNSVRGRAAFYWSRRAQSRSIIAGYCFRRDSAL